MRESIYYLPTAYLWHSCCLFIPTAYLATYLPATYYLSTSSLLATYYLRPRYLTYYLPRSCLRPTDQRPTSHLLPEEWRPPRSTQLVASQQSPRKEVVVASR